MSDAGQTVIEETEEGRKVHPVADMFPMMAEDELNDLAKDIKANGLIHPIVLDADGMLIDGRNRLEACRRAEVEPTFTTLNGQEPVTYILSANVSRRHLNKGQAAMAVARALILLSKIRDGRQGFAAHTIGVSNARISQAVQVIEHAPELADAVLFGAIPLNEAYEQARKRKQATENRDEQIARVWAKDPDLAALVQEERITLAAAWKEIEERERKEREYIELVSRRLDNVLTSLDPAAMTAEEWARQWLLADPAAITGGADFSLERVRRAIDVLETYVRLKEEENEDESIDETGALRSDS